MCFITGRLMYPDFYCRSVPQSCPTFYSPMECIRQASLSFTISWSLFELPFTESVMPSNRLVLCRPLSSCLQSFPAWGSFPMSQFFLSGGQSIGVSASESVLPMNSQDWSPCSPRDSRESSPTPQCQSIYSSTLNLFMVQLSHPHITTAKTIALIRRTFVGKAMSLLFNMLSRLVITFF